MESIKKLQEEIKKYMEGIDDPEKLKALSGIASCAEDARTSFEKLTASNAKLKDDLIESYKHSAFRGDDVKEEAPIDNRSPFDIAADNLRKELNKNAK